MTLASRSGRRVIAKVMGLDRETILYREEIIEHYWAQSNENVK